MNTSMGLTSEETNSFGTLVSHMIMVGLGSFA